MALSIEPIDKISSIFTKFADYWDRLLLILTQKSHSHIVIRMSQEKWDKRQNVTKDKCHKMSQRDREIKNITTPYQQRKMIEEKRPERQSAKQTKITKCHKGKVVIQTNVTNGHGGRLSHRRRS